MIVAVQKREWISRVRPNGRRQCARCEKIKPQGDFYMSHGKYYHHVCKRCAAVLVNEHRNLNREAFRTTMKKSYRKNWLKRAIGRARIRASLLKVPFDISIDDLEVPEHCPVLGMKLEIGHGAASPSIDRIDAGKGYVNGNVAVISMRANAIKNDASIEEHEAVIRWMKSKS